MLDPRDAIEAAILDVLQGIQPPSYDVPVAPVLVTRAVKDFSETQGQRPALVLIMGPRSAEPLELSSLTQDVRLNGVVRIDLDVVSEDERATAMNRWYDAVEQALEGDFEPTAFGLDVDLAVTEHDQPAIASTLDLLQGAVHFQVRYLLDRG